MRNRKSESKIKITCQKCIIELKVTWHMRKHTDNIENNEGRKDHKDLWELLIMEFPVTDSKII